MAESTENIDVISGDGWSELLRWLPGGIEDKMRETGAFTRCRKIKQPTSAAAGVGWFFASSCQGLFTWGSTAPG